MNQGESALKKTEPSKAGRGNQGSTPPKLPSRRRLATAQDLRVFLSDVLNRANRNEVDPATARTLAYIGQVLAGIISTSDLEKRLEALEAQAKENNR